MVTDMPAGTLLPISIAVGENDIIVVHLLQVADHEFSARKADGDFSAWQKQLRILENWFQQMCIRDRGYPMRTGRISFSAGGQDGSFPDKQFQRRVFFNEEKLPGFVLSLIHI